MALVIMAAEVSYLRSQSNQSLAASWFPACIADNYRTPYSYLLVIVASPVARPSDVADTLIAPLPVGRTISRAMPLKALR